MRNTLPLEDRGFLEFSVCDAGYENCEPCHKFGPRIRNYYLIHFVIRGEGTFKSPRGKTRVREGEAFIIRKGEVTVYEADAEKPWEYMWLGFRGSLAERFVELSDVFSYESEIIEEIREAFNMKLGREEMLTGIVFKLYARMFGEKIGENYSNKVASYINSHYMENIRIADISATLGLNRKYLARVFKNDKGISMQEFLVNKRLHEAKKLLKLGYSVEQCAYMVGYNDSFGFSKAFKKKYGISPKTLKMQT